MIAFKYRKKIQAFFQLWVCEINLNILQIGLVLVALFEENFLFGTRFLGRSLARYLG